MKITPYTTNHLPAWLKMRAALFHDEDPKLLEEEVRQITKSNTLKSQPFQCLLAFDDSSSDQDRPIGFIELTIRSSAEDCMTSPVLYVEGWFVDAGYRGRGVGKALMEAGFVWGRARGCVEVGSDARVENVASAEAHFAMGFVDAGVIRCFRRGI